MPNCFSTLFPQVAQVTKSSHHLSSNLANPISHHLSSNLARLLINHFALRFFWPFPRVGGISVSHQSLLACRSLSDFFKISSRKCGQSALFFGTWASEPLSFCFSLYRSFRCPSSTDCRNASPFFLSPPPASRNFPDAPPGAPQNVCWRAKTLQKCIFLDIWLDILEKRFVI